MRKFLDKIKSKWQENKAEFILQALSLVLAFTLLVIGVTTTPSAQAESRDLPNYTVPAGTYTFNATLTAPPIASGYDINVSFSSGGVNYNRINITDTSGIIMRYRSTAGGTSVVYNENNRGWVSETVKTITTNEDMHLPHSFYQWFDDNTNFDAPDIPAPDPDPDPDPENPSTLPEGGTYIPSGIYTFNETIENIVINGVSANASINNIPIIFDSGNGVYSADNIVWTGTSSRQMNFMYTASLWNPPEDAPYPPFDHIEGSQYGAGKVYENGWLYPKARTIRVLADTPVNSTQYEWFRQNTTIGGEIDYPDAGVGEFMSSLLGGVFDALDACEMYAGLTLLDVLKASLGICLIIWLLKLLAGG